MTLQLSLRIAVRQSVVCCLGKAARSCVPCFVKSVEAKQ